MPNAQDKDGKKECWIGEELSAAIAHVRIKGTAFQMDLGIPASEIQGTGARTTVDAILLAFIHKAGWKLERKQDKPDEGTPNEKAASLFHFDKRAGRPAGPSTKGSEKTAAGAGAAAKAPSKTEQRRKLSHAQAIEKLQRAWRRRRGKFTSRGTAIVGPASAALVQVVAWSHEPHAPRRRELQCVP